MTILAPPYDRTEAEFLRKQAQAQIWACWWCAYEDKGGRYGGKRYWPSEMLKPIGHRFACSKHFEANTE